MQSNAFWEGEPGEGILYGVEKMDIDIGGGNQGGYQGRGHNQQITRENVPMRNYSLPNRNATTWNLLPSYKVGADNVSVFKSRIDRHIRLESLRRSVYSV